MKRNACQKCVFAVRDDNPHCGLRGFRSDFNVERCSAESDRVPNGYELQEDGYFSWVEKKKEYPKTYAECCKILGLNDLINMHLSFMDEDTKIIASTNYHAKTLILLNCLTKLRICRDAYWKIAGEEMGLSGSWKPDFASCKIKYAITYYNNVVSRYSEVDYNSTILVFPTEEMRDAFYENFKELIESCKELL